MRRALPIVLAALVSGCSRPTSPPTRDPPPERPGGAVAQAAPTASDALPRVEASPPVASAPSAPAGRPGRVAFEAKAADVAWVRRLRRSRHFRRLALPAANAADPLLVTWRAYPQHLRHKVAPGDEIPADYAGRFELVVAQGAAALPVDLGVIPGPPDSLFLTSCERQGYRLAPDAKWSVPRLPNLVASFSAAISPSSSDYLLVAGPGTLYLLARYTHDGECPVVVHQGPLETCADMKYELLAEVRFSGEPRGEETVETIDASGARAPFDCANGRSGDDLRQP
jgi:hypothetical protein